MSAVIVNIEFTEMKKNKKESLKFTLKGDDSQCIGKRLYDLAGSIVHMEITDCLVGKFPAEFVDIKKSAKGVVANFLLKGDLTDMQSGAIYSHSGGNNVELTIESSQMSIEDFHSGEDWEETEGDEQQDGLEVKVAPDGTVELIEKEDGKVTNISTAAQKKLDKAKAADPMAALMEETKEMQDDDSLPM